jgi:hypothetical protein
LLPVDFVILFQKAPLPRRTHFLHGFGMRGAWEQFFKKAKKQGKYGACHHAA